MTMKLELSNPQSGMSLWTDQAGAKRLTAISERWRIEYNKAHRVVVLRPDPKGCPIWPHGMERDPAKRAKGQPPAPDLVWDGRWRSTSAYQTDAPMFGLVQLEFVQSSNGSLITKLPEEGLPPPRNFTRRTKAELAALKALPAAAPSPPAPAVIEYTMPLLKANVMVELDGFDRCYALPTGKLVELVAHLTAAGYEVKT